MSPKKFIQAIGNHKLGLQERLFRLIVLIGFCGLGVGVIVGFFSGESSRNLFPLILSMIIFMGITWVAVRFRKIQLGAVLIAAMVLYLVLPFNFLTSGGIYGGAPIWFLFGFVFTSLVVKGKQKYVLIVSGYVVFFACYYIAYFYPEKIIQHTMEMAYVDSIVTLTIVSVITCGMIMFQNVIYQSENRIAKEQRKEIEELSQAQNRFFSSMSHEIRTPINTIIGLNEMILREEVSDEVAADAKSIQGASKMLLALINDILDMSKIESGKMEIVPVSYDLGAMLSDIVNMIWVRAKEKSLEFHIDVEETIPAQLYGDEVRIKQILINLLNNAVKYTKEGSITLSIQCRKMEANCAQISFSVADTGMGIKKESIPYLFTAFKRVEEEENRYIEGTGLGLSIVKQLVDLMDGEIEVNSVYRKGSTFVVTLPQKIVGEEKIGELALEARHALNTREHYKQLFEAPKAHILIVDDNETNLMVAKKLLRNTQVNVDAVTSGAECLKRTLRKRYDVILMDHLMPEMDGIECLHAIRSQTGGLALETPVVILTANAGGENQALYRREGFDGYLLKPVSGIQLETELLRHLPKELVKIVNSENFSASESPVLEHNKKRLVMITTDSVCDLPEYLTKKHRIMVMPYRVLTDGGEFLDGLEVETDGLLSYIEEGNGKRVHSEAPETADYEKFFADHLTKAQYIVHITMAKNASKGYENALEASKTFDNVRVVDSGHLSSGMGLMVLHASDCAEDGMQAEAIVKELDRMRQQVRTSFIVGNTQYLARAGRISSKINTICQAFMLHPVIVLKKYSMKVGAIRMGTRETIRKKYVASVLNTAGEIDKKLLFITHAGLTSQELDNIKEQIAKKITFETVICQKASPAISTNCGPGSFGLLFMMENG